MVRHLTWTIRVIIEIFLLLSSEYLWSISIGMPSCRAILIILYVKISIPIHRGQLEVKLSFKSNIYTHNHIIKIGLNIEITTKV